MPDSNPMFGKSSGDTPDFLDSRYHLHGQLKTPSRKNVLKGGSLAMKGIVGNTSIFRTLLLFSLRTIPFTHRVVQQGK